MGQLPLAAVRLTVPLAWGSRATSKKTQDTQCAPCANGGQSWWPCNVEGLCQCKDAANQPANTNEAVKEIAARYAKEETKLAPTATSAKAPATSAEPTVKTAELTKDGPTTPRSCKTDCATCVGVPGNEQKTQDTQCAPCANGGQSWWPCNVEGLCQCKDAPSGTTVTVNGKQFEFVASKKQMKLFPTTKVPAHTVAKHMMCILPSTADSTADFVEVCCVDKSACVEEGGKCTTEPSLVTDQGTTSVSSFAMSEIRAQLKLF